MGGRFVRAGNPWIEQEPGARGSLQPRYWVDSEAVPDDLGALSGGERRILLIPASIGGDSPVELGEAINGWTTRMWR